MREDSTKFKVQQEVMIMKTIACCDQVIRLLEVFENSRYFTHKIFLNKNRYVFFVLEYAPGGDLLRYVKKRGRLTEPAAKKIFADIVAGIFLSF